MAYDLQWDAEESEEEQFSDPESSMSGSDSSQGCLLELPEVKSDAVAGFEVNFETSQAAHLPSPRSGSQAEVLAYMLLRLGGVSSQQLRKLFSLLPAGLQKALRRAFRLLPGHMCMEEFSVAIVKPLPSLGRAY